MGPGVVWWYCNHGNSSVVFAKCQKCFPYYSWGAIATAIKDFKGTKGLAEEGFLFQPEREHQQMRTPESRFTESLSSGPVNVSDASRLSVQHHKPSAWTCTALVSKLDPTKPLEKAEVRILPPGVLLSSTSLVFSHQKLSSVAVLLRAPS